MAKLPARLALCGRQRLCFTVPACKASVEAIDQEGRRPIADIPVADDNRRRTGIDERACEAEDSIPGQTPKPCRATAQHHEIRLELQSEDFIDAQVAVVAGTLSENQRGGDRPDRRDETVRREMKNAATRQRGLDR